MTLAGCAFIFAIIVMVGVVSWHAGHAYGARPLTRLKPGEYYVEVVVGRFEPQGRPRFVRLVLSWHVDYGHYEYRIVDLDGYFIVSGVRDGDTIRVVPGWGGPVYSLVRGEPKTA